MKFLQLLKSLFLRPEPIIQITRFNTSLVCSINTNESISWFITKSGKTHLKITCPKEELIILFGLGVSESSINIVAKTEFKRYETNYHYSANHLITSNDWKDSIHLKVKNKDNSHHVSQIKDH
jgi:hypothetical protein